MIKTVIFDFDGVLFDSVDVKTEAFRKLFEPYGTSVVEQAVAHHLEYGGVSRYKKIRHYHEIFIGEKVDETFVNSRAESFANLVVEGVVSASWMPGVKEALGALKGKLPLYICSGTPEDELRNIVKRKGIDAYFDNVYGSPAEKPEILRRIFTETNTIPNEAIFIGDAMTDYRAASETGTHFIGFCSKAFDELNVTVLNDLSGLPTLLENDFKISP